jgi:N-acetylneuraminic acid mutarotase
MFFRRRSRAFSSDNAIAAAAGPVVESLESRTLLHTGHLHINVNFQPAGATLPTGYFADAGLAYGDRGNGWNYGWDAANTTGVRERNKLADQRYDTINHTQAYGARKWEIDVPNGQYNVHLVAGDPNYNDSVYKFNAENTLVVNGTPTATAKFVEGTATVTVTDGRLTISNASGAVNNKLAFIDIESAETSTLPQVSITASDASAGEGGNNGAFTITRTGATTYAQDVSVLLAGSADHVIDYEKLFEYETITIPAGSASVTVQVKPVDDNAAESSETVILKVLPEVEQYTIAGADLATVTIADNDFSTRINFQPATVPVPAGYLVDSGNAFGARGNGLSYGWSSAITGNTRDRNNALSPDQRYDTLIQFNTQKWELAVPNGTYSVGLVAGDATYFDTVYQIDVEGVRFIDGTPTSGNRWFSNGTLVNVTDGRLTLSSGPGYKTWNKLNFIDIARADDEFPVVRVTAPTSNASENGPTSRAFTFTRTGSVAEDLLVYITVGGNASNGQDYDTFASPVTIPAGQSSMTININPVDDAFVEGTETVTVTLASHAGYVIGAASNATIRINDNDLPTGNTITWTTKAGNPLGRAEALRAVVDGKLYVFGGFASTGPVNRHDVYDPATNTWTSRTASPTRITHAGVAVDGRNIYVAGGYIGTSSTGTGWAQKFGVASVWKYNVDTNQWSAFTALPKEVAGGGLVVLGRELHWVSGNNNQRQDIGDHYVLNLDQPGATWQTAAPLPFGRSHLGMVTLNGKIYAVGGQFGNDETLTTQKYVHAYDPATNAWTRMADLPTAISHIASATFAVGDRIVMAGGETAHTVPTDLVYAFDPSKNEWASMTKLPAKRFSGVAAEIDGDIWFTTGSTQTTTWKGVIS